MADKKNNIFLLCVNVFSLGISIYFLVSWQTVIQIVNTCVVFLLNIVSLSCFIFEIRKTKNINENDSIDENLRKTVKKVNTVRLVAGYSILFSMSLAILSMLLRYYLG